MRLVARHIQAKIAGSRILTAGVLLGLVLAVLPAVPGAWGREVSEAGNPWLWMTVGPVTVKAEAVHTPDKLFLGLSYRKELAEGQGMLFFMAEPAVQTFCMRGMHFSLDFIWIADGRVAGITRDVPPTYPGELQSPGPVTHVLEVPGGFARRYGVKAGDPATWR